MDTKTRTFVEACEQRAAKATDGEWGVDAPYNRRALLVFACDKPQQPIIAVMTDGPNWNNDADFIAHARTDLPEAVRIIREQDAEIERLRGSSDRLIARVHEVATGKEPWFAVCTHCGVECSEHDVTRYCGACQGGCERLRNG